jgi:glucose/arabinose dehydrogenase
MPELPQTIALFSRAALVAVLLVLLCAACGQTGRGSGNEGDEPESIDAGGGKTEDTAGSGETSVKRVEVSTLATNLEVPWSFAFLPDGDALVTERDSGKLLRVSPSGDVREIHTLPESGSGEGGLLGVAVSPDYREDRYVYAYYTTERDNRVVSSGSAGSPSPYSRASRSTRSTTGVGSGSGPTACST